MSRAAGRALLPRPRHDDPVRATTAGVGELLLAARDAGARRIVIGCGGSSTTDGGLGAYEAVGSPAALRGIELVVACDVTTRFADAAAVFGPQKGATRGADRGARPAPRGGRGPLPGRDGHRRHRHPGRRCGRRPRGRARRPRRPDRARLRLRGRAGRPGRPAGTGGPGRHRGGTPRPPVVPRQGARRRARAGPGPGRRARPSRSSASPAAPTRRSSPRRLLASTWSA